MSDEDTAPTSVRPRETTPARRKIRKAADKRGLKIAYMEWTPIGGMVEMSGRDGGWYVEFDPEGHALGYNADDVVDWIERGMADPNEDL